MLCSVPRRSPGESLFATALWHRGIASIFFPAATGSGLQRDPLLSTGCIHVINLTYKNTIANIKERKL